MKGSNSPEGKADEPAATLGGLLYADPAKPRIPEAEWHAIVQRIAAGDQRALHELFARSERIVTLLALRITGSAETADEVTVDVFHEAWRRAGQYDVNTGPVLGWLMNLARSRAIDRVRHDGRKKRAPLPGFDAEPPSGTEGPDAIGAAQRATAVRDAVGMLLPTERRAVEGVFFSDMTHAEAARHLGQPLGTLKTRIRSALAKLRRALARKELP